MLDYAKDEKAIFLAALEQATALEREAYLRNVCCDDPELLKRVKVLLAVHEQSRGPLDAPSPGVGVAPTVERPIAERPGTVIGPYKLLEQIGEGGFGVVFMAEQQQPIRRKVALKVLKPGMDTRQVVARFEAERQALALMDHPNIAHVFDGGTVGQAFQPDSGTVGQAFQPDSSPASQAGKPDLLSCGRPYFVMELVRGAPITEFCDQNRLAIRQRLDLFVDVCQAVQHAHQKGIIHRDIKPSNVLVTLHDGTPVVKVIDFGIAKALGQQLTEKTLFTNFAQMIGTPLYMSPEQAEMSGLDIDTRSDIYSLGVLLYELLTGTTPFEHERLSQVGYDEMRRIIREEDPPKPSTRISTIDKAATTASEKRQGDPRKLSKLYRGELDWIVMKALEKDRNRRYETATGFALDVRRYLNDEQVVACPPTAGYRLRKLLRRHRGPAAAICAVLVVLLGGIVTTGLGLFSARSAQRRAEGSQRRAEENFEIAKSAVDDYLNNITADPDLKRSDFNALRKKLLESAVPFYQRLVAQKPGDAAQEAARGRAYDRLADVRREMGDTTHELTALAAARAIFAGLAADFPCVADYRFDLAISHRKLGQVLFEVGRTEEAETAYGAALDRLQALTAEFPNVPEYREGLAASRHELGGLLAHLGKRDEARGAYLEALASYEQLAADFPTLPESREAGTRHELGRILSRLGKPNEAEAAYRAAVAGLERLAAAVPTVSEYRKNLAGTRHNLGLLLAGLGQHDEAEAAIRAALAIQEKLAADFPMVPEYRKDLARIRHNLGWMLGGRGMHDEAESAYRAALAIQEKLAADFPNVPEYRSDLALSLANRAMALGALDRRSEAEMAFHDALAIADKLAADFPTVPKYRERLGGARHSLGVLLTSSGKRDEAEVAYRAALAIRGKLAADNPRVPEYLAGLAYTHNCLATLLTGRGKCDEAEAGFRTALAIWEQLAADVSTVPEYRGMLALTCRDLGFVQARKGQWKEATAGLARAIEIDPNDHRAAYQLGFLLAERGELPAYQEHCNRMLSRWGTVADPRLAGRTAEACLLLAGGVRDRTQIAPLIETALSLGDKPELYPWALFRQGLYEYRCGRFTEARTACANSRQRAMSEPALAVIDQTVEAMSLYRLGTTEEARQTLAAAIRLCEEKGPKHGGGDLGANWHDWLCCRILCREAEALVGAQHRAALHFQSDDAKAHIALGRMHARKGKWKEAAASLARAIELDPHDHQTAFHLGFILAEQGDLPAYQEYCDTMLSRWGEVADPMLAERTAKACLLLPGGVTGLGQLAPLVQSAMSIGKKHELYKWVLFTQGLYDYRCGRFAEAGTACENSREGAKSYFAALPIIAQTVEAMSLHRLGRTDEARQALAAADRLFDEKGRKLESGDLGEAWPDWLCCRILRREAEETLKTPAAETKP